MHLTNDAMQDYEQGGWIDGGNNSSIYLGTSTF